MKYVIVNYLRISKMASHIMLKYQKGTKSIILIKKYLSVMNAFGIIWVDKFFALNLQKNEILQVERMQCPDC